MKLYKENTDTFDVDRATVYISKNGKQIYIDLYGQGNGNGPGHGYIKMSRAEFDQLKTLISSAVKQGTDEFADRFDDPNDNWAFQ